MTKTKLNKYHFLIIVFFVILLGIIIKSAWVMDDAYISFRYAKNFIKGYGLRWNVTERVQAFTNPLYLFFIIPLFAITKNVYLSSILLSIVLTMAAVIVYFYPKKKTYLPVFAICILILISSKAFIDFSTSGLENPMTFLILAIFYREFYNDSKPYESKSFLKLCFIASLITINRIDAVLLFIPALCYSFFKGFKLKKIWYGFLGFSPFIVWEIFSLLYYGFLFPNTAYAKLNITTSTIDLIRSGVKYIFTTAIYGDALTLIVIFAAFILGIFLLNKKIKYLLTSVSILIYICYIIYIGGDFMVGRFLAAPFFLSVIMIFDSAVKSRITSSQNKATAKRTAIIAGLIVLFAGCISHTSPITSPLKYDESTDYVTVKESASDARIFYYNDAGLSYYLANSIQYGYNGERPVFVWGYEGQELDEDKVYVKDGVGFVGYFCPDKTIIIDKFALADSLLARIPAPPNQRIAHNERGIPAGYIKTLETGENVIENESLHEYYDKLSLIISGKIFEKERLIMIFKMNTGSYDYLIDEYVKSDEYNNFYDIISQK